MTASSAKGGEAFGPDAFARFLAWLAADIDQAIKRYWAIRNKLFKFFIRKGCPSPDDLFDKTVDIVVRKISSGGDYENREAYCFGVARNVWREYVRQQKPGPLVTNDIPSPAEDDSELLELKLTCMERCMEKLLPHSRDLILRFHRGQGSERIKTRKELAKENGGANALRIKAFRIRKKLYTCVTQCVARSSQ
jgi:hypothetical protein